jgi:tripartite ATP-independent transporter DctM subunit
MEVSLIIAALAGVFFVLMLLGFPVALSFIAANVAVLFLHSGTRFFDLIAVGMFSSLNSFVLIAVPLFIIMGEVIVRCRFVDLITNASESIFGRLKTQDALLTVGTGTVLAVLSGAPIATSATLGSTMVPRMVRNGYRKWFACGTALGGAALATLIPPSSLAIVLATLAEVSPTRVLIGGLVPGLMCSALFIIFILFAGKVWPQLIPAVVERKAKDSLKTRLLKIAHALPLGLIVLLVLGVIFFGIATATEAAALGAVGTILLALAYRRLTWKIFTASVFETAKMTCMLFLIISASGLFGRVLTLTGAGPAIVDTIVTAPLAPFAVVGIMIGTVLIMGCFMDSIAMMMITIPLFVPAVIALGFDPLWFCILISITVGIAGITPPVGMVLYALKGACPLVEMEDVYRGAAPFFLLQLVVIVVIMLFPAIGLWLPGLI